MSEDNNSEGSKELTLQDRLWNGFKFIIDKVVMVILVLLIQNHHEKQMSLQESESKKVLAELDHIHEKSRADQKAAYEQLLLKQKQQYDQSLAGYVSKLQLTNQLISIDSQHRADLRAQNRAFIAAIELENQKVITTNEKELNRARLSLVQERLSDFYHPLAARLERASSFRQSLHQNNEDYQIDSLGNQTLLELEQSVLDITDNYRHLAATDSVLEAEIKQYSDYFSQRKRLSDQGLYDLPSSYGYRNHRLNFDAVVEARKMEYQRLYDEILERDTTYNGLLSLDLEKVYANITMKEPEARPNVVTTAKRFSITLARTNQFFLRTLDDNVAIYLTGAKDSESATVQIGYYNAETLIMDTSKRFFSNEKILIGGTRIFTFPELDKSFRVRLEEMTPIRSTLRGFFRVESWQRLPEGN